MSTAPEKPRPQRDDIDRVLGVLYTPADERQSEDTAFLTDFARQWFQRKSGEKLTPKRIMENTPELWEAYLMWDREQKAAAPTSPARTKEEPAQPAGKKKKPADPQPAAEDGEPPAHTPTTARGEVMSTLDAAGRLSDSDAYAMASRDTGQRAVKYAKWGAGLALTGAMAVTGYFGVRAALSAKQGAEKVGGEVQRIQQERGNFAEQPDPFAPIPGSAEAREAERRRTQQEQNQQPKTKQKGR